MKQTAYCGHSASPRHGLVAGPSSRCVGGCASSRTSRPLVWMLCASKASATEAVADLLGLPLLPVFRPVPQLPHTKQDCHRGFIHCTLEALIDRCGAFRTIRVAGAPFTYWVLRDERYRWLWVTDERASVGRNPEWATQRAWQVYAPVDGVAEQFARFMQLPLTPEPFVLDGAYLLPTAFQFPDEWQDSRCLNEDFIEEDRQVRCTVSQE